MKKILAILTFIIAIIALSAYFLIDWKHLSFLQTEYVTSVSLDKYVIPTWIRYTTTTDEVNKNAIAVLRRSINEDDVNLESYDTLIVGPTLWKEYINDTSLKKIWINSTAIIGKKELPIRTYTSKENWMVFMATFKKELFHKQSIIRKANPEELKYYWSTIPFDIEEPLLIVESGSWKYLFNFNGNTWVNWIDKIP
jgi:hypothetical protein